MGIMTGTPTTSSSGEGRVTWAVNVNGSTASQLWFSAPAEHEGLLSERADAALLGLLLPAMRSGKDLHVAGTVTDELLHSVNGPVQSWVRAVLPMYSAITVTAQDSAPPALRPEGVATGFSAGIDSYSALDDYLLRPDVPASMRVTHLLFNDVGSHQGDNTSLALARLASIRSMTSSLDAPLVDIRSNLNDHFEGIGTNTAFMNTHTIRNASVAQLLGGGLGTWYYASAVAYRDVRVCASGDMAVSDVVGLPLLSTAALSLVSVGSERTRVEKTLQVCRIDSAREFLDVCIDGDPTRDRNCSRCWKCLRTLLTLDVAGELDAFCPARFDRDVYLAHREDHMAAVLSADDPLNREIVDYAATVGFAWPGSARRAAAARRARRAALDTARKGKRRIRR